MHRAWLGLGTNMGDKNTALAQAMQHIANLSATSIIKQSDIIETAAWGITDQPAFLNMAIEIQTTLPPGDLLNELLKIEETMGRVRTQKWGPRIIDIDILIYENIIMDTPELTLPHPFITQRSFVLIPLAQIAPELLLDGKTVGEWTKVVNS
ncbi:MAG: 2-amino-4-hydroxy-6-hydroxymethyldihydropteridine diphosphokinase [bacterium]